MMLLSILDKPPVRRLRVYALDPSLAQKLQTAPLQEIVLPIRWEQNPKTGRLDVGPIGEYIEVVDVDPASGVVYPPVDLDDPNLLAQDGLPPSEGYPQFHQQMVYAVAMATIERFEQALGRVALWAPRQVTPRDNPEGQWKHEFVRRLRMYPHALRDQNAYYSPDKKAILFGYFPVRTNDARNTPGTTVFACLSHDVIAHEVTHALLDGVHPRFNEQSNPDVPAFHEAFADIVALFQRFSYTDVVRDEIARTRGRLENENMLAKLAQQFGSATGRGSALRDALGMEVDGKWQRRPPDTTILEKTMEPHERGAILVAAVFGAFLLVYGRRTEDLYRIATQGSGVLPEGEIHPDMARRLAEEAAACAGNILRMCIRAIDYCPPVNITFGEYLRAVMTADINIDPEDELRYRVAFVESFRQWGIYPRGTRSMSVEALTWPTGAEVIAESAQQLKLRHGKTARISTKKAVAAALKQSQEDIKVFFDQAQVVNGSRAQSMRWDLDSDRLEIWKHMQENRRAVWGWLHRSRGRKYCKAFGLVIGKDAPATVYRKKTGEPTVEVHSVRTALRRDAHGSIVTDLVVEITQRRRGYFKKEDQEKADKRSTPFSAKEKGDFKYRAGCTIIIDTKQNVFRHIIRTPGPIDDDIELERIRQFPTGDAGPSANAFAGMRAVSLRERAYRGLNEPFALLHRHSGE
jgi:hypothetical protein